MWPLLFEHPAFRKDVFNREWGTAQQVPYFSLGVDGCTLKSLSSFVSWRRSFHNVFILFVAAQRSRRRRRYCSRFLVLPHVPHRIHRRVCRRHIFVRMYVRPTHVYVSVVQRHRDERIITARTIRFLIVLIIPNFNSCFGHFRVCHARRAVAF